MDKNPIKSIKSIYYLYMFQEQWQSDDNNGEMINENLFFWAQWTAEVNFSKYSFNYLVGINKFRFHLPYQKGQALLAENKSKLISTATILLWI